MQKISSGDAKTILKQAGAAIRYLIETNKGLVSKLAQVERTQRVEKIAKAMEQKGINSELTFEEKIAQLQASKRLDVVDEAVKMSAPTIKLASVGDHPAGSGLSAFENFILTGEDAAE